MCANLRSKTVVTKVEVFYSPWAHPKKLGPYLSVPLEVAKSSDDDYNHPYVWDII